MEQLDGADHLRVSFTVTFAAPAVAPRRLSFMDWSQVKAGGLYTSSFFDAADPNPFESATVQLLGRPWPPAEWLADKDRLFPQFRGATATHQACTFEADTGGASTSWAWATLTAVDVYGNQIHHEVAPENPY